MEGRVKQKELERRKKKREKKQGGNVCPESSQRRSSVTAEAATGFPLSGFIKQPPKIIHHREKSLGSKTCS